ncbi:MAG TPA: cellulase family glycosylhydrolase [Rugosimonospora sp.]|nr:cellulase family glycosylhydrolase [Rugosimonospora sp.]
MNGRLRGVLGTIAGLLLAVAAAGTAAASPASGTSNPGIDGGGPHRDAFVHRVGSDLFLDGRPFRFAGTNTYYLMYAAPRSVDDIFTRASAAGFTVLRTSGWLDIGNQDGTNSVRGKQNGVYFQYWDGGAPAYNDGPDGLSHLDAVIARAAQAGIKLVIPLTNNWADFGGMDQYVRWAGDTHHDDFYTDPRIVGWYQDWVAHLLNHVNPLTGLAYKDDPTIMTWELGNEPRCKGSGVYPTSPACGTSTLTNWVDTVSRYIKTIDRHHLVSVGDEGFYCTDPGGPDWTTNCGEGVDSVAFAALPAIDVLSFHLYPDGWGKTPAWGTDWITAHVRDARRIHKAVMMGEFGLLDKGTRNTVYKQWTDAFMSAGGNGLLYWMLAGIWDDGNLYPDYDGFTVYCPSPVCQTISNAETRISTGQRYFPPVADNDNVTTAFNTPITFAPASNDVAYLGTIRQDSIDLDPATPGQQRTATVPGGQFALGAGGSLTFTPAGGFHGKASVPYTVADGFHHLSNVATVTVTVKPDPGAPVQFASFETSTLDGWAPASWQANAGTVSQQSTFHTDGSSGLHVDAVDGGWFGTDLAAPVDISAKSALKVDLRTGAAGTSVDIAVQVGSGFTWCQGTFGWVPQNTTTTFAADLTSGFSCDAGTLNDVRAIWVYISPGSFDLDNVRAE